jgi:uncharacterized protein YndB with AHSA1/START domain
MTGPGQGRHGLHISTPSDSEVVLTRVFDAPAALVFEAYTTPGHIQRWMLGPEGWTMPVCEVDLRDGGSYRFVWRRASGTEMEIRGGYRQVVPPSRLVTTEAWGGDWPETVNTLTFVETNGRTTLTNTMRFPSKAARDAAMRTGMESGSRTCFDRLDGYLEELARR